MIYSMSKLGYFDTKRILKSLHVKRNIKKLIADVENGDAKAMEKIGIDFFRRVVYTHINFEEKDEIDIFEGVLLAIYWFDKAVENGKIDSNYWIGETLELYAYCGIGGQAYYGYFFREFLKGKKYKEMFQDVVDSKKGYLYEILKSNGINIHDNIFFYQKAADVGDSSASFRLGEIYLNWWFNDYYEHIKYNESLSNSDSLDLAQKYLCHACKHGEPNVIPLIFKVFEMMRDI